MASLLTQLRDFSLPILVLGTLVLPQTRKVLRGWPSLSKPNSSLPCPLPELSDRGMVHIP